ncbi:PREDICTED: silicatein-like [Amphimedon queenslandica]|nr:PREDICTED: silicatein-like [Amphimedon queenslandica]|eukprot:XP_003383103.1 PREDICTED: silicatein-like [Amphimedon queenslandica]
MRIFGLICAFCFILSACATKLDLPHEWHSWKATHGKSYESDHEELGRHIVWLSNKKYIDEHNKYSETFGYTLKMNKFGDLTNAEFSELMTCVQDYKRHNATDKLLSMKKGIKISEYKASGVSSLPDTVDWRTGGAVTWVKDQLRCGCSYAFAAAAALEGAAALARGSLVSLSAQNIVDCSIPFGNHGCSCGDVNNAFMYVIDNGGLDTENVYPYVSKQDGCKFKSNGIGATATGIIRIASGDETSLASALATAGPVAVYIDASHSSFQFYHYGVLNVPNCSRTNLSHAMILIGYGKYGGREYWLLKNSWGPNWGTAGYIMMSKGKSNQCGIATYASFPTL